MSGESDWSSELQAIVNEASRVFGRPVAIDDRRHRLLETFTTAMIAWHCT